MAQPVDLFASVDDRVDSANLFSLGGWRPNAIFAERGFGAPGTVLNVRPALAATLLWVPLVLDLHIIDLGIPVGVLLILGPKWH